MVSSPKLNSCLRIYGETVRIFSEHVKQNVIANMTAWFDRIRETFDHRLCWRCLAANAKPDKEPRDETED
jgi:hypothetical protein